MGIVRKCSSVLRRQRGKILMHCIFFQPLNLLSASYSWNKLLWKLGIVFPKKDAIIKSEGSLPVLWYLIYEAHAWFHSKYVMNLRDVPPGEAPIKEQFVCQLRTSSYTAIAVSSSDALALAWDGPSVLGPLGTYSRWDFCVLLHRGRFEHPADLRLGHLLPLA